MKKYHVVILVIWLIIMVGCNAHVVKISTDPEKPGVAVPTSTPADPENPTDPVDLNNLDSIPPEVQLFSDAVLDVGTIYYVDTAAVNASDSNSGSESEPWETIDHAADMIGPGVKIIVKAGYYNERVRLLNGGTAGNFAVFEAEGEVRMHGFTVEDDYIAINGFIIEDTNPGVARWRGGGIWVSANNLYLVNNKIYNFHQNSGIEQSWGDDPDKPWHNVHIRKNYIYGCAFGFIIAGHDWLVEENEVERLLKNEDLNDCDYMRFFGDRMVVRKNYFHGTNESEVGSAHVDIFQSYDAGGASAKNILFHQNMAVGFHHQALMVEGSNNSHENIFVIGNVFVNSNTWGLCAKRGIINLIVMNNTYYDLLIHGVGFNEGSTGIVKNNIFVNSKSTSYFANNSTYVNGYNLVYNSPDPSPGADTDIVGQDPLFINPDNIIGADKLPFTADDGLIPGSGSPAIGTGEAGVNIGAYQ